MVIVHFNIAAVTMGPTPLSCPALTNRKVLPFAVIRLTRSYPLPDVGPAPVIGALGRPLLLLLVARTRLVSVFFSSLSSSKSLLIVVIECCLMSSVAMPPIQSAGWPYVYKMQSLKTCAGVCLTSPHLHIGELNGLAGWNGKICPCWISISTVEWGNILPKTVVYRFSDPCPHPHAVYGENWIFHILFFWTHVLNFRPVLLKILVEKNWGRLWAVMILT